MKRDLRSVRGHTQRLLQRYGWLLLAVGMVLVAFFYAMNRIFCVDFFCVNGDYQTYNALRRVLDGQVPYKDFANYLGMGPIILQAPLLALHNTFAGSLFVTHFVASIAFMLLVYLVFYLVTAQKLFSGTVALLLPKLISSKLLQALIPVFGKYTSDNLELMDKPNNSVRIIRLFLPVFYSLIILLVLWAWKKRKSDISLRQLVRNPKFCAVLGGFIGFGLTWSNDFSFACIGSATLILIILAVVDTAEKRQGVLWRFVGYFPGLFLGMFFSVFLATGGYPGSYVNFTQGVASWQFWYYGLGSQEKIYSLSQLLGNTNFRTQLLIYLFAMGICLYRLISNKDNDRLILFVFLYTSIFAAQFGYILGSGANNFTEGTATFCILLFWALILKGVLFLSRRLCALPLLRIGALLASCLLMWMIGVEDVRTVRNYRAQDFPSQTEGYLPALEGVFYAAAPGLKQMEAQVGDAPLFATYATALNDMLSTFQPTGVDYIIHALGDEQWNAYVENFRKNQYPFVQTTNHVQIGWEVWAANASWDFYRELYANYQLQGDYAQWSLWEYSGKDKNVLDAKVEVSVIPLENNRVEIAVESEETQPCYVDVTLSWENFWISNAMRLQTWKKAVFVYDPSQEKRGGMGEGYFRPPQGTEQHAMVFMENGKGKIILEGQPLNCTSLQVENVHVNKVIAYQLAPGEV